MALGRRDHRGRAAQGKRLLGDVRLGAEIFSGPAQGGHARAPSGQGHVRQRLSQPALRAHSHGVARARLPRRRDGEDLPRERRARSRIVGKQNMPTPKRAALVTGAASGISRAAALALARAGLPLLRVSKGCIVNTASIVGIRPGPQPMPYAASKAAVVNLTKTLAYNLGQEIRVNAVAPGWMEGDWMQRMLKDKYEDLMGKRAKATPLKRCVTAEDVAETMMSLVQSNRFVTGEVIVIDGGFSSST